MITQRSWQAARPYLFTSVVPGFALLVARRRSGLLLLGGAAAVVLFFRDPHRPLDPEPDIVYSAADGLVRDVEELRDPWIPGGNAVRVSTFLGIHNVHVTRSPVTGNVTDVEEVGGRFAPAFLAHAGDGNRQERLAIDGPRGRTVVVQIAGMVARRISRWVEVGDEVSTGQRIGVIHFGSRTDVLVPAASAHPLVRRGDRVRAGVTPLLRYRGAGG